MSETLNCDGYKKLLESVERDEKTSPEFHDYRAKLDWIIERAKHYAQKSGLSVESILDAWEEQRSYWYMNYYQDCNQPLIESDSVRVFDTTPELLASIGSQGFRCPLCELVSTSPYKCDSGAKVKGKVCDWKVYGLLGDLGKGISVFVKKEMRVEKIFMPIAWEVKS